MNNPFNRPYARGRIDVACWLNSRPDGTQYLAIELGPLGRYTAEVNPGSSSGLPHRGVPYASSKGIKVWKCTSHGPDGDQTYLQVKAHRFPGSFRVYLEMPKPAAPPPSPLARASVPPASRPSSAVGAH